MSFDIVIGNASQPDAGFDIVIGDALPSGGSFDIVIGSGAQPDTGFDIVIGTAPAPPPGSSPFDIVIGDAPQPDIGFDIVIGDAEDPDPDIGVMLSFDIPPLSIGTVLLAIVIRNENEITHPVGWFHTITALGDDGVILEGYTRTVDGTEEETVDFLSLELQELQGSLIQLNNVVRETVIEATAQAGFSVSAAPEAPEASSLQTTNTILRIWSLDGVEDIDPPTGYTSVDTYSSAEVVERSLLVAYKVAGATGPIAPVEIDLDSAASGRSFTIVIKFTAIPQPQPVRGYFWGPMYPDYWGHTYTIPQVFAQLSLEDPVTVCSETQNVFFRAKQGGVAGNLISVQMTDDALTKFGELEEIGTTVHVKYAGDLSNMSHLFALLTTSTLIEMIGTWNNTDIIPSGEGEFSPTFLSGGVDERPNQLITFWGPNYPDNALFVNGTVQALGPVTAATFALLLESGFSTTYTWDTSTFKAYDGKERRASNLDLPGERYEGQSLLIDEPVLQIRSIIQRYGASGQAFLLGLPYEDLILSDDVDDFTVFVETTTERDWIVAGQRVLVMDRSESTSVEAVIQSKTSTAIVLDVAPGIVGAAGGRIMPAVPIFLEPQCSFGRHPGEDPREIWEFTARAAMFGFQTGPTYAKLPLEEPITFSGVLAAVVLVARVSGTQGNGYRVSFAGDAVTATGEIEESGTDVTIRFIPDETTLADVATLFNSSTLIEMTGDWNDDDTLTDIEDEFVFTELEGALDGGPGTMGVGAELVTYGEIPIFDRYIHVEELGEESAQTMNEIIDLGGIITNEGEASSPDWGRHIMISRPLGIEFQWFKLFLYTVRGSQVEFLLPTWRKDLLATEDGVGSTGGSGILHVDPTYGDFFAWWPKNKYIQVIQPSKTSYYLVDNAFVIGDGTVEMEILTDLSDSNATLPLAEPILMISWMEFCRFESDIIPIEFQDNRFRCETKARVIQHIEE